MQLSERLTAVAGLVSKGNRLADIGCDHAHTSIYLVKNGIVPTSIAMDINKGPLERARENISRYGCEGQITTRLSDGAKELKPGEADTLLISGMGGGLTMKILKESKEVVLAARELVLQPQSEIDGVRRLLHELGFRIVQEFMLSEDGKHYTGIQAQKGSEHYEKEVYYRYGRLLLESRNMDLREFLLYGQESFGRVVDELLRQKDERNKKRLAELQQELSYIEEALTYYK